MQFRRRRKSITDYRRRLKLLKGGKPRLVVRKSLRYINAQIIMFATTGDNALLAVSTQELKKLGWTGTCDNTTAAYLLGFMIGKRAKEKKIDEAVLDSGLHPSTKGSRVYAVVKGAIDAGLKVPCDESTLPSEDRIKGTHIAKQEKYKNLPEQFEKIKEKIK
jgi:large subunit ribosomal protein L18